jgi:ABC-type sugar transport system permease subunit
VCRVEGANKWEEFWYVTFPMLNGSTLLVIVCTAIEMFTAADNAVMRQGYQIMQGVEYGQSSAMLWTYFALVGAILGVVVLVLQKFLFSKWAS